MTLVVLANDTDEGGSRLLAFKRKSGEQAWEAPRPLITAGWSTPFSGLARATPSSCCSVRRSSSRITRKLAKELWSVSGFSTRNDLQPSF